MSVTTVTINNVSDIIVTINNVSDIIVSINNVLSVLLNITLIASFFGCRVLGQLFPECEVVYQAVLENRRKWEKIRHILTVRPGSTAKHQLSMEEILKIENVDDEELTERQINGR